MQNIERIRLKTYSKMMPQKRSEKKENKMITMKSLVDNIWSYRYDTPFIPDSGSINTFYAQGTVDSNI